jgi:hypothetical protein
MMAMWIHVCRDAVYPATKWRDPVLGRWHRASPRRTFRCQRCGRRRWAAHLRVRVGWDVFERFCAESCSQDRP